MRKYYLLKFTVLALTLSGLVMSCKNDDDDDEEPVKPKISFETSTMTVNEADGVVEVKVKLDKAAEEDIDIEYELGGSAIDVATVNPDEEDYDYEIVDDHGVLEIEGGETEGIIQIQLYSDVLLEDDNDDTAPLDPETIQIEITDVDTEDVEISTDNTMEISVEQEDGVVIVLAWALPNETDSADMDILVRYGANTSNWQGFITGSISSEAPFEAPEAVFIPNGPDIPAYGMSYVYYAGNRAPLGFEAVFVDLVDGVFEGEANQELFGGEYQLDNINKWRDTQNGILTTKVVQTIANTDGTFVIEDIVEPETGSRAPSSTDLSSSLTAQKLKTSKIPPHLQSVLLSKMNTRLNKK